MKPWLTIPEFIAAAGMSRRSFFNKSKEYETRKDGKVLYISSASLPEATMNKLATLSASNTELRPALPSPASAPLFASVAPQGPGRRIALSPEAERQAVERLRILQPLLDFCSDPVARARYQLLHLRDGQQVKRADDMAEYLAETHSTNAQPVTRPTLWRWKKRFEEQGLAGLVRKIRADKGRASWVEQYPAAAELVAATWLQPFRSKQLTYDRLQESGLIPAYRMPTYKSVCLWLETLPKAAVVLAREGERAHNERMAPYLSRGYIDLQPNQVWVADTMLHDVLVMNDCFGVNPDFAAIRVQLTAIMDMRSRKIVGTAWVLDGSSRSITTALRLAVERYGPPQTFYCDNGNDFKKVGRGARPANYRTNVQDEYAAFQESGALRRLGIDVQFCLPYHAQSKPIERQFRTLHQRFDAQFPHYTGSNADKRPDGTIVAATNHGKLLKMGRHDQSPLIPASHFVGMAKLWIEEEYNAKHRHSGRGMNNRTPDQVFEPALANKRSFDATVLDTLLWSKERRRVRESAVTVAGRRLTGASAYDSEVLYTANETDVLVCFDPNAPHVGVVTTLDGIKLCDVEAQQFAAHSPAAQPLIEASIRQARGLRNSTAASVRGLRKRVTVMGQKPALQMLSERALLPMAVGENIVHPIEPTDGPALSPDGAKLHTKDIVRRFHERRAALAAGGKK